MIYIKNQKEDAEIAQINYYYIHKHVEIQHMNLCQQICSKQPSILKRVNWVVLFFSKLSLMDKNRNVTTWNALWRLTGKAPRDRKRGFLPHPFSCFPEQTAEYVDLLKKKKKILIKTYSLKLIKCTITSGSKWSQEKLHLRGVGQPMEAYQQAGKWQTRKQLWSHQPNCLWNLPGTALCHPENIISP